MRRLLRYVLVIAVVVLVFRAFHSSVGSDAVVDLPPQPQAQKYDINLALVHRIECMNQKTGKGGIGTAWIIGKNTLVTAAHVVDDICLDYDSQLPVTVKYIDRTNDLAIVVMDTGMETGSVTFGCNGFHTGHHYTATGWADGETLRETMIEADQFQTSKGTSIDNLPMVGLRYLKGMIYHGMSGGPIFDDQGIAVGINTATDELHPTQSFSRPLSDTILCGTPRRD